MKGIYSVNYVDASVCRSLYKAECYDFIRRLATFNFLYFLQSDEIRLQLTAEERVHFTALKYSFLSGGCNDFISASLFFNQNVSKEVLSRLKQAYPFLGKSFSFDSKNEFDAFMKGHAEEVHYVTIATKGAYGSYCTVEVPSAYLFHTAWDSHSFYLQWPETTLLRTMMDLLSKQHLYNPYQFKNAVYYIADVFKQDPRTLYMIVSCIIIKNLLLRWGDEDIPSIPFGKSVLESLKEVC